MAFSERLQLIVDATTAGGEAGFARLAGSATEADRAAKDAGESVARAAQRVADARLKEADAAGVVKVAEQRLVDLRERGVTSGAQYVAAQEKLEAANRRQHVATRDVERATEALAAAERESTEALGRNAEAAERNARGLKDLAAKAGGLVAGISLGDWARDAVLGFVTLARDTGQLARSMNTTTEEAGAFLGLVGSLGLELNDLLEIQAEFADKVANQGQAFAELGAQVQRNADGTTDWAETLVDFLGELQGVEDATVRNRLGFQFLGEEGYKQLSRLVNSGVDVREALERIGTPITDEDIAAAAEFDATMLELNLSAGELGRTIGRAVVPILAGLVDAGQDVASILAAIPGPVAATTVAAIALGIATRKAGVDGTFMAGAYARASATLVAFRTTAALTSTSMATLNAAGMGAAAAGRGLMGMLGGPWGLALVGVGIAYAAASDGAEKFRTSTREAAVELSDSTGELTASRTEIARHARAMVADASATENAAATHRGFGEALEDSGVPEWMSSITESLAGGGAWLAGLFGETELAAYGMADGIEDAADGMTALERQEAGAAETTRSLNELIAEGVTGGREFAGAVREAAEAQRAATATSDLAEASIAAYEATTRGAVQTMLDLYSAQLGQRSGWQDVLTAVQEANTATEDTSTAASEVEQSYLDLIGTVLDYASTSADAAVEAARAAGTVLTPLAEAQLRADAVIAGLRESLNAPDLAAGARAEIQTMIDQLTTAQERGDIEAILTLTGAGDVAGELDETTEDRETRIQVESRGGPAVVAYLERITNAQRLALIRVESRGGPAVDAYLDSLATRERLAIIRVETRGGPAAQAYLDTIEARALRGAPRGAYGGGVRVASAEIDLRLTGTVDRGTLSRSERGRAHIQDIKAYERDNGTGWRDR